MTLVTQAWLDYCSEPKENNLSHSTLLQEIHVHGKIIQWMTEWPSWFPFWLLFSTIPWWSFSWWREKPTRRYALSGIIIFIWLNYPLDDWWTMSLLWPLGFLSWASLQKAHLNHIHSHPCIYLLRDALIRFKIVVMTNP